jgi:hypothetical protein
MDQVTQQLNNLLANPYTASALTLFLVVYGGMAKPTLPDWVADLFDSAFFRFLFLGLIAFTATQNSQVALITALVFTLTMNLLSERKTAEAFMASQFA